MIPHDRPEKRAWQLACVLCTSFLLALPVRGQAQAPEKGEVKAIVRISKQMIDDVASRKEITAAVPYDAIVLGFRCRGVIHGKGKLSVELITDERDATFVISSQGTADTCVRGVLGPIVAIGPAWGPFTSSTLVRFDGRKFALVKTTPWAQVNGELQRVEGRRGGPAGRAVGWFLLPLGQFLVPRAEREATPIGEYYLKNYVDELGEAIISRLNRTTAVEASLYRLFPEKRDWGFHLSNDGQFIQAAYGPPGSPVPTLPENPGRLKDVRMELWLRATTSGAQVLGKLSKQPLAKQLIQAYLAATLPELAALTEERSVTVIGNWVVICIGAPKAD